MCGRMSTRWGTAPTTHVLCCTQPLDDAGSGLACCTIDSRSSVSLLPPHQRTHRCCSLAPDFSAYTGVTLRAPARVQSQEHACVDARPLGGVQPPLHTCFAAPQPLRWQLQCPTLYHKCTHEHRPAGGSGHIGPRAPPIHPPTLLPIRLPGTPLALPYPPPLRCTVLLLCCTGASRFAPLASPPHLMFQNSLVE